MGPHALHDTRLAPGLIHGFLQDFLVHLMPTDPATARVRGRRPLALTREELVRRFLLQVLPKGFIRVGYFGFLANRCRAWRLGEIRVAPEATSPQAPAVQAETAACDGNPCPKCHQGCLQVTAVWCPSAAT